jgi:hypothetical protein
MDRDYCSRGSDADRDAPEHLILTTPTFFSTYLGSSHIRHQESLPESDSNTVVQTCGPTMSSETTQLPSEMCLSSLETLPSELRKLIVSYLAPSNPEDMVPGCNRHLQKAHLAHSCLREWATEYMFRDMALKHVLPDGASCHLDIFAVTPQNVGYSNM